MKLAREQRFDLYLLDSWLPDGTGIELCKRLREFDRGTPIMFLSAAAFETDKQAALNSGAQRYLVKPGDIQMLSHEVNALILAFANNHDQGGGTPHNQSRVRAGADDRALVSSV